MDLKKNQKIALAAILFIVVFAGFQVMSNANGSPSLQTVDERVVIDIGTRLKLELPGGSQILHKQDLGGLVHVTTVQVPMGVDEIMNFVEDAFRKARQEPEVLRTDQVRIIRIGELENRFHVGVSFEPVSSDSTAVLVKVMAVE